MATENDGPCYFCGEPTDSLAGNPGRWPVMLCHKEDPGVARHHHSECVSEHLEQVLMMKEQVRVSDEAFNFHLARANKAEAACAEMRGLLENINKCIHGVIPASYFPHILHALSSDCGKDYFSRAMVLEQVGPIVSVLHDIRELSEDFLDAPPSDISPGVDWSGVIDRALEHAKKLTL